jgi:transketolase
MSDTMRAAFGRTAGALVDEDPRVAIVLAEISTEYFDAVASRHPARVVNVGIMEQTMVGVAAGFAMEGFLPIVHSISPFVAERPYEQLKLDIGYQGLGGTFVGTGGSYDYAAEGATHHAAADASLMLAIPGMEVLAPGHPAEVDALLRSVYANGSPTYMRLSIAANGSAFPATPGGLHVVRHGSGATVLAFGPMLDRTLEATAHLDVTVVYATSVRPFDAGAFIDVVGERPAIVTVEPFYEHTATPVIVEAMAGRRMSLTSIGVPRSFIRAYGTAADLDVDLGLDAAGLRRRIDAVLAG